MSKTKKCRFNPERHAGFIIDDVTAKPDFDYNYCNPDILLKVNKYGVKSIQYAPPGDVMLLNSNDVNNFSEWNVWIKKGDGAYVSAVAFPTTEKPVDTRVDYSPEYAEYNVSYKGFSVKTRLMTAAKGGCVIMSTVLTNTSDTAEFTIIPLVKPYLNPAALAMWDRPEWYLKTAVRKSGDTIDFYTRLFTPSGDPTRRRAMTYSSTAEHADACQVDLDKVCGADDFFHPQLPSAVFDIDAESLSDDFEKNKYRQGYPSVYAIRYSLSLRPNESWEFSQVLSIQDKKLCGQLSENALTDAKKYLLKEEQDRQIAILKSEYDELFALRSVKTPLKLFDSYINEFLPLQLSWVCKLDRGWPTGMQGTRDAANDYMGMAYYHPEFSRKTLIHLCSCMYGDGRMPRQVSVNGKNGNHDLRNFADSTAFLQEFIYEYVCLTADYGVLRESTTWLDNDEVSTVLDHYLKGFDFYTDPKNTGEHGLCKIYAGDWLDPLNLAGQKGIGESVMVSCQVYANLKNAARLLRFISEEKYSRQIGNYLGFADRLKDSINRFAYNREGFYNGIFCDNGNWVFSDRDPDGQKRIYSAPNYWAIYSGVADGERTDSILKNAETLKTPFGYRLFSPAFSVGVEGVGRIASGDMAEGLWENGAVYNHGSNCFRARALAKSGRAEELLETIEFILPYDEEKHPAETCNGAPYALVNCYQLLKYAQGYAGNPFLTGTVAMVVRIIYCDLFGVRFTPGEVEFRPCLTKSFDGSELTFSAQGKKFQIQYRYGDGSSTLNGSEFNGRATVDGLPAENEVVIYYR